MSIWGSFCTFGDRGGDPPYADYTDATRHYTTTDAASLASTPRGGFLDAASSGVCGLIRFSLTEAAGAEAEVWLDRRQAAALRDALTAELEG